MIFKKLDFGRLLDHFYFEIFLPEFLRLIYCVFIKNLELIANIYFPKNFIVMKKLELFFQRFIALNEDTVLSYKILEIQMKQLIFCPFSTLIKFSLIQ